MSHLIFAASIIILLVVLGILIGVNIKLARLTEDINIIYGYLSRLEELRAKKNDKQ